MENRKINIWQPLIYALLLTAGLVCGFLLQGDKKTFGLTGNKKIDQVVSLVNRYYVDSVDDEKLTETVIVQMLHDLDPHSNYIPAAELVAVNEQLEGNFEGIGVEFNLMNDTIFIASVLSDGPSEKVGIMPGDRIIKVDGKNVAGIGITNGDVIKKLKGPKGTSVNVAIKRTGVKNFLDFTIQRDKIPLKSVESAYMVNSTTGYIKVDNFAKDTHDELKEALDNLRGQGLQNLILDLRGNPGGYLHIAQSVASEFLEEGKLIVYTEGRAQAKKELNANQAGTFTHGKLVVLVDENSASASEIVSGAIQDWDRGIIVGRRSYGKGLVQESFQLADRSAIRLTIARYYTPTGRSIQKPYADGYDEYEDEISRRYKGGELDNPDSVKKNEKLAFKTPGGRTVYGGGGIYPDIFVPVDTAIHTKLMTLVYANGFISRLAYRYADEKRGEIKNTYKTAEDFGKRFAFNSELEARLKTMLASADVPYTADEYKISSPLISAQANALIARQVYGKEAYFVVQNQTDPTFDAALKALEQYDAILKGNKNLVLNKK